MGVQSPIDEAGTRPCVYCGRPVPQRGSAGRPFRYCRDNDGQCQRNARNGRMRERNSPGLAGQVARSWELVERLELVTGTLADALHAELSPAGVERQATQVRAEAATHIAGAHAERDEARREAESARADLARLTDSLTAAHRRVDEYTAHLQRLSAELDVTREAAAVAERLRDEARAATTAQAALRVDAQARRDEALAAIETHKAELADAHRVRDAALAQRDTVEVARDEAVAGHRAALAERDEAVASHRATLAERDEAVALLTGTRAELTTVTEALATARDRIAALETASAADREVHLKVVWERDAARADHLTATTALDAARAQSAASSARIAVLTGELAAAEARGAAAGAHAAQLTEQVTNVTAALARLGSVPTGTG